MNKSVSASASVSAGKDSPRLSVMNFLNEISIEHPQAISFASGRPAERFFRLEEWLASVEDFVTRAASVNRQDLPRARALLAQYGRTTGVVNDLISQQIANDEGIQCPAERIVVTSGCQEAVNLAVQTLCAQASDVLLAGTPTYIGATGVADLAGIPIVPVAGVGEPAFPANLRAVIAEQRAAGRRPRAIYLIPEFDNPTGTSLPERARRQVLDICAEHGIVVLEDNPYGLFRFDGDPAPSMYSLDEYGVVVYLGTYSKTICPSVRTGYMLFPQTLCGDASAARALQERIAVMKSFVTVNSSQILQAVVGGVLLKNDCSLAALVAPSRQFYHRNRDAMIAALEAEMPRVGNGIHWNVPAGGFFLTVSLPFEFLADDAAVCARDFGVIPMPLSFFALDDGCRRQIRLAFSNLDEDEIREGVARLAAYLGAKMSRSVAV